MSDKKHLSEDSDLTNIENDNIDSGTGIIISKAVQDNILMAQRVYGQLGNSLTAMAPEIHGMLCNVELEIVHAQQSVAPSVKEIGKIISAAQQNVAPNIKETREIISAAQQNIAPAIAELGIALTNTRQTISPIYDDLVKSFQSIHIDSSVIESIQNSYQAIGKILQSPEIQWLRNFDWEPIYQQLRKISEGVHPDILRDALLQELYKMHWFPGILLRTEGFLWRKLISILGDSQSKKNKTTKIDKVIYEYYSKNRIEELRKSWREFDVPNYMLRLMNQGVRAYYRKEYGVTAIVLPSLWERIICDKANDNSRREGKKTKNNFHILVEENDYPLIMNSYFDNYIMYQIRTSEEVIPEAPGRNAAAHCFFNKYPTRKAALCAIIFTDFIIRLHPIP